MVKRASLGALLLASVFVVGGCRLVAPGLESVGGAQCGGYVCGPSKTQMIVRQWARDTRKNERFIDNYLLNYDINDPYRGDCLVGY
jgi:hypothetical protein